MLCKQHGMHPWRHYEWQEGQLPGRRLWEGGVERLEKCVQEQVG